MESKDLLRKLNKLGLPLLETEEDLDVNKTISEVVKQKDIRLWEGFPILLANTSEKTLFHYNRIIKLLEKEEDRETFVNLFLLSLAFYKYNNLNTWWQKDFFSKLSNNDKETIKEFLKYFREDRNILVHHYRLSPQRIRKMFNTYFKTKESEFKDFRSMKDELTLEYTLSQLFSPKQKELLFKKLSNAKLTKTEKEYFSRVVKKKVVALANDELHDLAKKILKY